jgi:hypothetical protein
MNKDCTYETGFAVFSGLGQAMEGSLEYSAFLKLRKEMNEFLLCLNYSQRAEGKGQQIHFLFLALGHLDKVDREIRVSLDPETLLNTEKIHDKIRNLQRLILNYIKQLSDPD